MTYSYRTVNMVTVLLTYELNFHVELLHVKLQSVAKVLPRAFVYQWPRVCVYDVEVSFHL